LDVTLHQQLCQWPVAITDRLEDPDMLKMPLPIAANLPAPVDLEEDPAVTPEVIAQEPLNLPIAGDFGDRVKVAAPEITSENEVRHRAILAQRPGNSKGRCSISNCVFVLINRIGVDTL
jgi:hypothetical protein